NSVLVSEKGQPAEDRSKVDLTGKEVRIEIDLHSGSSVATVVTNDLTHAYVEENSAYSS
ncbi:MAG: bifunctional ornithine acetyltransferase/N-acetylglutamate synthase, partial [Aquiluna sp.]